MAVLVGVYVDVGVGVRRLVAMGAAAGGCRYNVVNVSLLGSMSV
jgi:hypothetical protein